MRGFTLLFLILCSFQAELAELKTIRAIVSESNAPPFALFDQESHLTGGISKDILEALANHSKLDLQFLALPRGRVEQWLLRDDADIACFLNPDWVEQPEQLLWSNSLFNTRQVIIRRNNSPAIQKMTDLLSKRIGTDRGFSYPEFDRMFSQRLLIRDDASSLESNLSRLQKQRLDAVLAVDLAYHYYQQTHGSEELAADPLWTAPDGVYCALNPHQPELANYLLQFLLQMAKDGTISDILQHYKPTQPNNSAANLCLQHKSSE